MKQAPAEAVKVVARMYDGPADSFRTLRSLVLYRSHLALYFRYIYNGLCMPCQRMALMQKFVVNVPE